MGEQTVPAEVTEDLAARTVEAGVPGGGCCGAQAQAAGAAPVVGVAAPCCGTARQAAGEGSCCGSAAKAEAVASGAGCCG